MILFWNSKTIILSITFLCACLSLGYISIVSPTYQATIKILPSQESDLAEYSEILGVIDIEILGKNTQRSLYPDRAFDILYTNITSDVIKAQFLSEYYLPNFNPKNETEKQEIIKLLDKSLKINGPTEEEKTLNLSIEAEDAKMAAQWATDYTALAIDATHSELLKNLQSEISAKKQSNQNQITTLQKLEQDLKNIKISHLQDSLKVAKAMGLENPMPGTTVLTMGKGNFSGDNLANENSYLRGTKSLAAEIEVLSSNKNQDAYISGLPKLLTQQALLQTLNKNPIFSVARIDKPATPPYEPIKPIKPLILLMGIIFGLFLGMFVVLIANAIRNE